MIDRSNYRYLLCDIKILVVDWNPKVPILILQNTDKHVI